MLGAYPIVTPLAFRLVRAMATTVVSVAARSHRSDGPFISPTAGQLQQAVDASDHSIG